MAQTLSSALVAVGIVVAMTGTARSQVLGGLRASLDVPEASSICGLPVLEPSMLPPPNVSPANHLLAELSVDIRDYRFSNGVIGKLVTYNITERD
jgi:hypothetical protein